MSGPRLLAAAKAGVKLSVVQRTGYLIDAVCGERVSAKLADWLTKQKPRPVLLRPDNPVGDAETNERWRIVVNEEIAADLSSRKPTSPTEKTCAVEQRRSS